MWIYSQLAQLLVKSQSRHTKTSTACSAVFLSLGSSLVTATSATGAHALLGWAAWITTSTSSVEGKESVQQFP